MWWRIGVVGGQRIGVGGEEGEGHQVLTSTPAGQQAQHIDDVTGIRLATNISGIFSFKTFILLPLSRFFL